MTKYEDDLKDLDEIQEDDASLLDEDEEEQAFSGRRIFTDKLDPPVDSLYRRWKDGDLILDPIFQRRKVWDDSRSSKLIESALLEVPLPVFYLAESYDSTVEVIDGQQRLNAFFKYIDNDYSLRNLKALPDFNKKKFKELNKPAKNHIRNYPLRTVTFKKESDENLRFDIFERLNTGAVPLNQQELRNCVYRGPYNQLLIELSEDPDFMFLLGLKTSERRMKDVEYVLRFSAFYHSTYLKYKPSMARFLTEEMKEYQKISDEKALKLRMAFKNSITLIRSLLGEHAFKRFYKGNEDSRDGYWEPRRFNASLYDVLMYSFADKDKNLVMANLDSIREALIVLMTVNQDFIEAIELSTSSLKMVTQRFDIWRITLDTILANGSKQPRCFSRELKQKLYDQNPTCNICGQYIAEMDDSAIDHIEQYWLGGKTIPENARLTHRYCNWARPKDDKVK